MSIRPDDGKLARSPEVREVRDVHNDRAVHDDRADRAVRDVVNAVTGSKQYPITADEDQALSSM